MAYTTNDGTTSTVPIPDIRLRPGEVDTIDVARAIRSSGIREEWVVSAGLEFNYSTAPGTVVIAAESVSSDGNQVFRLPLIDADSEPSSTGGYPWKIDGSSSTFVYITNVTDRPQQYVLQLNFDGGVYAPGLKSAQPHQTAVFDIRSLRDSQVKDEHGRRIPLENTSGQVHWSVAGEENLVFIGRAEQADLIKGVSSTYACVNCCPDSCAGTWLDPGSVTGFPGDTTQFTAFQQNEDCFRNPLTPFSRSAAWSSTDSSVATVDSTGFATAQDVGNTNIQGTWTAFLWDLEPNNTCTKTIIHPLAEALCDVLAVTFIDTSEVGGTNHADFFGGIPMTSLNITSCGGERFGIKIRFRFNDFNTTITNFDSSVSPTGMFALAPSPVDGTYVEYYGNDNPPYTITYLKKVRSDGIRNVTHTLQGTAHGRSFMDTASVTLICH